jgi:hypothetical protein
MFYKKVFFIYSWRLEDLNESSMCPSRKRVKFSWSRRISKLVFVTYFLGILRDLSNSDSKLANLLFNLSISFLRSLHSLVFNFNLVFNLSVSVSFSYSIDSFSSIFLARSANLSVDNVSPKQLLDGEMQQMIKLLPEFVKEDSSSLVSLESRKGIWFALSASLEMQFVSWKSDLLM